MPVDFAIDRNASGGVLLHVAGLREVVKANKYSQSYKDMDDLYFEPFVLEIGGVFRVRAQEVIRRIRHLITQ